MGTGTSRQACFRDFVDRVRSQSPFFHKLSAVALTGRRHDVCFQEYLRGFYSFLRIQGRFAVSARDGRSRSRPLDSNFEPPLEPFDPARRKRDSLLEPALGSAHPSGHRASLDADPADSRLDELLGRISHLMGEPAGSSRDPASGHAAAPTAGAAAATIPAAGPSASRPAANAPAPREFIPLEPASLEAAGVSEREVAAIALKFLLSHGTAAGRDVSTHLCLPFTLVQPVLAQMKQDQWVVYRASAHVGDYVYELTALGRDQARRHHEDCTYCGAAPVALADYIDGVRRQSIDLQRPEMEDLQRAMSDLLLSPRVISQMAQAIRAGRGLFLYGPPGNGKTSVAERISLAFGATYLDSAGDRHRRRHHSALRPVLPRTVAARTATRRRADRRPVDSHPPADGVGRRRIDDGSPRGDAQSGDRHERGAGADEKQLRRAGDRRFRPAADAGRRLAQSLDRAAAKTARLSESAQRARRFRFRSTN